MEYKEFKNRHEGGKIIVSGCGTSASLLESPQNYITIGVNDLSRLYTPNYLVVVNDKNSFPADRWKWIGESKCPHIFTHLKNLAVDENARVLLQLGRYGGSDLDKDAVDYTSNSTYIACIVAAYMGAKKIGIIGCDWTHNHFFAQTGEHSLSKRINSINMEYSALKAAFERKGIEFVNLSPTSRLTCIPKQDIKDF